FIIIYISTPYIYTLFLHDALPIYKSTVSKIAYFVLYIVLIYIVLSSFHQVFSYARDTVTMMSDFMIALLPLMLGLLASFGQVIRSEEHTSELQSRFDLVCRLLLEK